MSCAVGCISPKVCLGWATLGLIGFLPIIPAIGRMWDKEQCALVAELCESFHLHALNVSYSGPILVLRRWQGSGFFPGSFYRTALKNLTADHLMDRGNPLSPCYSVAPPVPGWMLIAWQGTMELLIALVWRPFFFNSTYTKMWHSNKTLVSYSKIGE